MPHQWAELTNGHGAPPAGRGAAGWSQAVQAHSCTMRQTIPGALAPDPQAHTSVRTVPVVIMDHQQGALRDW